MVLVRDQAAKDSLPPELQSALTLTIFESKGLEFDDVFLFNFFSDSPADERTWRVITSVWMQRNGRVAGLDSTARRASHDEEAELLVAPPRPEAFDRH